MANDDFGYGSTPPNPASVHQHFNGHISPSYQAHHVPPPQLQNGHGGMMQPPPQLQQRAPMHQQLPPAPHAMNDGWGVPPPNLDSNGSRQRGSGASTPSVDYSHHRNGGTPPIAYDPFQQPTIQQAVGMMNGSSNGHGNKENQNHRGKEEFSKAVQETTNQFFSKIFSDTDQMPVKNALEYLIRVKNSTNPDEQEILSCIIANLFEEYQHLQHYPEKELNIVAEIYGGLIREHITDFKVDPLRCAEVLRKIAEALNNPDLKSGSAIAHTYFKFGVHALEQMKMKLYTLGTLCVFLTRLENFARLPDTLKEFIHHGTRQQLPPHIVQQMQMMQHHQLQQQQLKQQQKQKTLEVVPASLNAPNVDALVRIQQKNGLIIQAPSTGVTEQVAFFFNNLSQVELPRKVREMRQMMDRHGDQFDQWLAQQLVVYRVLGQPNFIPLYANFVHEIHSRAFETYVHRETFRNIHVLLKNDKRVPLANSTLNDRQHLKTLGSWLGLLTLAKERPILYRDMDLKSLLLEATKKGELELNFAVPFVAKILYSCEHNVVFKTSSAWLQPVFEILCEIHGYPEMKNNIKFEIELLCKKLGLNMEDHRAGEHLKDIQNKVIMKPQLFEPGQLNLTSVPPPVPPSLPHVQGPPGIGLQPNYDAYNSSASSSPIPQSMRNDNYSSRGASPIGIVQPRIPTPSLALQPLPMAGSPQPQGLPHPLTSGQQGGVDSLVNRFVIHPHLALFRHYPQLREPIQQSYRRFVTSEDFNKVVHAVHRRAIPSTVRTIEELVRKDFRADPARDNVANSCSDITQALLAVSVHFEFKCHMIPVMFKLFRDCLSGHQISSCMADEAARKLAEDNVDEVTQLVLSAITVNTRGNILKSLEQELQSRVEGVFVPNNDPQLPEKLQAMAANPARLQMIYKNFMKYTSYMTETRPYDPFSRQIGEIFLNLEKVLKNFTEEDIGNDKALRALFVLKDYTTPDKNSDPIDIKLMCHLISNSIVQFLYGYDGERQVGADAARWSQILREVFVGLCKCLLTELLHTELVSVVTTVIVKMEKPSLNHEAISFLLCHEFLNPLAYDTYMFKYMSASSGTQTKAQIQECFAFGQNLFRAIANTNVQHSVQMMLPDVAMWCAKARHHIVIGADPTRVKAEGIMKKWMACEPLKNEAEARELDSLLEHHNIRDLKSVQELIASTTRYVIDCTYDVLKNNSNTYASTALLKSLPGLFFQFVESFTEQSDKDLCLRAVFDSLVKAVIQDHDHRDFDFHGYPYDYLLKSYMKMFSEESGSYGGNHPELLMFFARYLGRLQPKKCPRFTFGWFNNVGSASFMAKYLNATEHGSAAANSLRTAYVTLLIYHLQFLYPFLRDVNVKTPAMQRLQLGTTRVLFYIQTVYPDIFCEHHHMFCDVIPPNCFNLRTQVLSAIPRALKEQCAATEAYDLNSIETSELMNIDPVVSAYEVEKFMTNQMFVECKEELDNYLNNRTPVNYLTKLRDLLKVNNKERGKYNISLLNIIVLYVGMEAIKFHRQQNHQIQFSTIGASSYMDVLQNLAVQFCNEGRYLLFNAMANQLRYPNSQTKYFSMALLYIFRESTLEHVQEQIARTLFERAICFLPHPWGVVATIVHLVNVEQYALWSHDFANCASEVSGLFRKIQNITGEKRRVAENVAAAEAPN